jgi:hypothetical protein
MLLATDRVCGVPSFLFSVHWAPVFWVYNVHPRHLTTYFDLVQSFGIHGANLPLLETFMVWFLIKHRNHCTFTFKLYNDEMSNFDLLCVLPFPCCPFESAMFSIQIAISNSPKTLKLTDQCTYN